MIKIDPDCKICKGKGIKWYVSWADRSTGEYEVDKDVCDCVGCEE